MAKSTVVGCCGIVIRWYGLLGSKSLLIVALHPVNPINPISKVVRVNAFNGFVCFIVHPIKVVNLVLICRPVNLTLSR